MKLLSNDTGENGVCTLQRRAAPWRMLICLIYADSGAITRGRHARRSCYKIMSARIDLI